MVSSPSGNVQRLSSTASKLVSRSTRSPLLEHIVLDATGALVVPVDADANPVPQAMLPDPVAVGADVGSEPAGVLQQSQSKLHAEPLG